VLTYFTKRKEFFSNGHFLKFFNGYFLNFETDFKFEKSVKNLKEFANEISIEDDLRPSCLPSTFPHMIIL
jgi:hypothetical protein